MAVTTKRPSKLDMSLDPSPRNIAWFKRNAWFEGAVLPTLREHVATVLAGGEL
ncbi:uracil-DNA glycosylase [Paraburkholderia sp. MM5496-R1]